jgi:hypothetical protein
MKTAIFAVLLLLATTGRVGAQVDSSCLVLWQDTPQKPQNPDIVWFNPDSAKVDMCLGSQYLQLFARDKFSIAFLYYIIPDSLAPIADTQPHDWHVIDTTYSGIRNAFDSIETLFGPFTIRHGNQGDTNRAYLGDTLSPSTWWLDFYNYVNVDTVEHYLYIVPDLAGLYPINFGGGPMFYEGVNDQDVNSLDVWPQPCNRELHIEGWNIPDKILSYDPLGRQISIPFSSTDGTITLDVSKQPNGIIYCCAEGHVFKILIQH